MSKFKAILIFASTFLFLISGVYAQQYITGRQANQPIEFSPGYNFFGIGSVAGLSQDQIIKAGCVLDTWNDPSTGMKLSYTNRLLYFSGSSTISRTTSNVAPAWTGLLAYSENSCTVPVSQEVVSIGNLQFEYGYNSFAAPMQITVGQLYTAGCQPQPWNYSGQKLGNDFDVFLTFAGTDNNIQRIVTDTTQAFVGYLVYVNNRNGCQVPLPELSPPQVSFTCLGFSDCTKPITITSGYPLFISITAIDPVYGIQKIELDVSSQPAGSSVSPSKSCTYSAPLPPQATCDQIEISPTVIGQYQFYANALSGGGKANPTPITVNVVKNS